VSHLRLLAVGFITVVVMAASVVLILSLSPIGRWPMAVLALTLTAAVILLTFWLGPGKFDSRSRGEVHLIPGPTADDAEEIWSVDEDELPQEGRN